MAIPMVSKLLRNHLHELALNDQRIDGREQWVGRPLQLEVDVLERAEGSAKVTMGDTIVYAGVKFQFCLLYTSPSPRDATLSRMPSSA